MSIAYLALALVAGAVTLLALRFLHPLLAILCAPLCASAVTALAAILWTLPIRKRRHGIRVPKTSTARAY
jgi:hypothetical protein